MVSMTRGQENGHIALQQNMVQLVILLAILLTTPLATMGQGLLVDVHPDHHFRIPRRPPTASSSWS